MSDKDWLDKVAIAASVYCEFPNSNEAEIDRFIEYLYRVYGYISTVNIKTNENSNNN